MQAQRTRPKRSARHWRQFDLRRPRY